MAELIILRRRFRREPQWRGWAALAIIAALAMMGFLVTFGTLAASDGSGGIFEKPTLLAPTIFGMAIVIRLFARRDARITTAANAARVST